MAQPVDQLLNILLLARLNLPGAVPEERLGSRLEHVNVLVGVVGGLRASRVIGGRHLAKNVCPGGNIRLRCIEVDDDDYIRVGDVTDKLEASPPDKLEVHTVRGLWARAHVVNIGGSRLKKLKSDGTRLLMSASRSPCHEE